MAQLDSVQRVPPGLLELLGMRGTGQLPTRLVDTLSGELALLDAYGSQSSAVRSAIGLAVAPNGTINLPVPAGQAWIVKSFGAQIIAAAGATFVSATLQISSGASGSAADVRSERWPTAVIPATGAILDLNTLFPSYLWLRAGSVMTVRIRELTGVATIDGSVNAFIYQLAV
jgi:hypothetical protein